MPRQFTLLGTLNVEEDGRVAEVMRSPKTCGLLAYLIITNQAHSREEIADLLWDSETTAQSLTRLRVLLGRTKKSAPELLVTRRTIAFEVAEDTAVDYQMLMEGLQSTESTVIDKALQLYNDELLSGFYLPDAPRFNDWLLMERERLRFEVQSAYQRLCATYEDAEAWEMGSAAAQRWLALEPLNETALRHLMQNLARSGQVTVALQQYERSREYLWQELAVDPEESTQVLAKQLADLQIEQLGEQSWEYVTASEILWPDADTLAQPGALPTQAYLPYLRNHDFTGRNESLSFLAEQLQVEAYSENALTQIVGISGMGGIGKTQLAVEYCYRYGRYYPGGVFWMSFAQADNVAQEVAFIGSERGLGLYQETERLTLQDQVSRVQKAWQEPIPRLLIFDNCEEEALLKAWAPKSGGCRILLTSRRGQWSRELGVEVRPLTTFDPKESQSLLKHLVPDISDSDARSIANELGHLPLALHLAGSFLSRYQQISPANYLSQIQSTNLLKHPSLTGRGLTYSPTDHGLNVARTFTMSFNQLDAENPVFEVAKQLLASVICFVPGEPIPQKLLLSAVTPDEADLDAVLTAEDGLAWLITSGLLQAKGSSTIEMHQLVASAASEILDREDARPNVEQAMLNWLNNVLEETNYLFALRLPSAHLQYITDAALKRADIIAAQLSYLWGHHLYDVADYDNAEHYLLQALAIQQKLLDPNHLDTAKTHRFLGNLIRDSRSDLELAQHHIENALTIHESFLGENHLETADSLYELGVLHIEMGNYEAAQQYLARSLAAREMLLPPNSAMIASSQSRLGAAYWYGGDFAAARPHFERALQIQEIVLGVEHSQTAISYHSLGALYLELGDYKQAQSYLEEALRIGLLIREPNHPVTALHRQLLGYTHLHLGNFELARTNFEASLAAKKVTLGLEHPSTAATISGLGELFVKMGSYETGLHYLEEAFNIRQTALSANHPAIARSLFSLSDYYRVTGKPEKALNYVQQALAIRENESVTNYVDMAEVLTKLGEITIQLEDFDAAQNYLSRALTIHETEPTPRFRLAETLAVLGGLGVQTGDYQNAAANYERALAIYEDMYGADDGKTAEIRHRLENLKHKTIN
jgi:tetratricopeptide (TPR) repeat protein